MKKVLLGLVLAMFILFCSGNSFAVNWTAERCVDSGGGILGFEVYVDFPANGLVLDPYHYDIYDIKTQGNYGVYCMQHYVNPSDASQQNYYCMSSITAQQYQSSSGCTNDTFYDITITAVGDGLHEGYYCIRDWNRTTTSRVNLSYSFEPYIGKHLQLCHLDTYDMIASGVIFFPTTPTLLNDFYIRYDTGNNATVASLYYWKPDSSMQHILHNESEYPNIEGMVDHSIMIPASQMNEYGNYIFNLTSCQGGYDNPSTWHNCASCIGSWNTSSGLTSYDCSLGVTGGGGLPPSAYKTAYLSDINADTWTPALGEIVNISVKVTNNDTTVKTYYLGLTVGGCNRNCYQDYDLYGDYRNVTFYPAESVILSREFKFGSAWFDVNESYDLKIGIYDAPNLPPSEAIDSIIIPDAFSVVAQSPNLKAEIISVNASVTQVAVNGLARINILIRNNGTQSYNFYVGLSIGKNDTYVFCNRYCYADCGDTKGTAACDYMRTGTIHPGQTVAVSRLFKFDEAFFYPDNLYDLAIGVYTAAYVEPAFALDSRMVIGYFNVTERPPCLIRSLQIYPLTDTIDLNQLVRYMWYTSYDCDGRIYWADPGGVVRSIMTTDEWNGTMHTYVLPGTSINRPGIWTYWAKSCATITSPFMTASCETSGNKTFTVTSEQGALNVVEPVRSAAADWLGIPYGVTLAFIAMVIIVAVGGYLAYKTKYHIVPVVAMIVLFLLFVVIGWIPWWILVIIVILAAAIVAKWGSEMFGGG